MPLQGLSMKKRLFGLLIWIALFVIAAMIIGSLLDFLPRDVRTWLGYIVILVAILWFLWSWFKWHRKQVGDRNELEWLDELVDEHQRGVKDHSQRLEWLVATIEREHQPSSDLTRRLERARQVLH
jgi:hypothetical protein